VIEVSIEPQKLPVGHDCELEIRFSNTGTRPCTDVVFRADLPPSFLLLRGRSRVEVPMIAAGDTRVHLVTVRPRVPGTFAVTSTNFSYRDEYGTPVRVAEFQAGLTVLPGPPPQPSAPDLRIDVVSGPLAPGEWDVLRLRVRSHSPSPLRGIGVIIDGLIRIAAPGPRARLPDLAEGQEAEVSFIVCPTATGRQVPAYVVVTYDDGAGRARVHNQSIPLEVGSQSATGRGPAAVPDTMVRGQHVLVLTALDLEYQAVRGHLTGLRQRTHTAGTLFETGHLRGGGGEITIALTGEGNAGAAVLAERAMSMFGPRAMLFVGVAGALKDDIDLGDVVVATRVYAYHGSKEEDDGVSARPRSWEAPHELEQLAHYIARAESWAKYLPAAALGRLPRVHFKPIAAGEVLLASRVAPTAQRLRRVYNDAAAIEMESAGVSQASQLNRSLPALIIRGISDRADGGKHGLDKAGGQPRAATHAAAFAVALAAEIIVRDAGRGQGPGDCS
jgi:nucleoside phosphorylase